MLNKILILIIFFPAGIMITKYALYIVNEWTGTWEWAERYLGAGGSYNACKILGIMVSVLSILYATGSLEYMIQSTIGTWGIFGGRQGLY